MLVLLAMKATLVTVQYISTEVCIGVMEKEHIKSLATGWVSVGMGLSVPEAALLVSVPTTNQNTMNYLVPCLSWMSTFVETQELVCCVENVDLATL